MTSLGNISLTLLLGEGLLPDFIRHQTYFIELPDDDPVDIVNSI